MSKVELDKIDRKILEVLQSNGRLTNLEVAEQVNLSPNPACAASAAWRKAA